jgi:hypothetical protein
MSAPGIRIVLATMLAAAFVVGCHSMARKPRKSSSTASSPSAGRKLDHDETLRWIGEQRAWRRVQKTKPIWVRAVAADEIGREFQTADHAVEKAEAGYVLSVGVAGEPWFQKPEQVERKYRETGVERRRFAFDDQERPYRVMTPREGVRNWGAQVIGPGIAGFFIQPSYATDTPLYAPAGGWVVRDDAPDPYTPPKDVWLVQQELFESTYEVVEE